MFFSRMSCPGQRVSCPYGNCLLGCNVPRRSNTKARRELHSGILASLTPVVKLGEVSVSHSCLSLQFRHGEFCSVISSVIFLEQNCSFPVMNIRKNKFLVGQNGKAIIYMSAVLTHTIINADLAEMFSRILFKKPVISLKMIPNVWIMHVAFDKVN